MKNFNTDAILQYIILVGVPVVGFMVTTRIQNNLLSHDTNRQRFATISGVGRAFAIFLAFVLIILFNPTVVSLPFFALAVIVPMVFFGLGYVVSFTQYYNLLEYSRKIQSQRKE